MMKTALFAAAAAVATLATAAPVLARPVLARPVLARPVLARDVLDADVVSTDVAVRYADLDLATPQGRQDLDRRIARAAKRACGFHVEGGSPSRASIACYHQARTRAASDVAARVDDSRLGG